MEYFVLLFLIICSVVYILAFSRYFVRFEASPTVMVLEGLKTNGRNFTLNRKPFRIMSGSFHYFRVPHQEWGDRLIKLKEMGLNSVDVYIPWNLHEPTPGNFKFSDDIHLTSFLQLVQTYELYAIVRPGPYICSEWDLGGLPSWLLRDKDMKLRSMYKGYIDAVDRYFKVLLPLLKPFQFGHGGPIIAFQIENEYGTFGNDTIYMNHLRNSFQEHGLTELYFVCDNNVGLGRYKLDGVLQAINFMAKSSKEMTKRLFEFQPDKPLFVTELWDGWFNHWGEKRYTVDVNQTINALEYIIHEGGSFNLYMWHGGTTFGFMNGANANDDGSNYQCDITSYDYDAPLSETGDITDKYLKLHEFINKTFPDAQTEVVYPFGNGFSVYGDVELKKYMNLSDITSMLKPIKQEKLSSMEMLEGENDYAQSYGYIVYKNKITHDVKVLKIEHVKDFAVVLLNGKIVYTSKLNEDIVTIELEGYLKYGDDNVLQILVENCGRVNYGNDLNNQRKGILGSVLLDGNELLKWDIYSLEFKRKWVERNAADDSKWRDFDSKKSVEEMNIPSMYKGELYVHHYPKRTFIILPGWFKGVVFINGFNLGRYWNIGPQKTLYVPAYLLNTENNDVVLFDLHGITKKYGENEYPTIKSTSEKDLGEQTAKSFLI